MTCVDISVLWGCQVSYLPGADGEVWSCCGSFLSSTCWWYWYAAAISFVGLWRVANTNWILILKMKFFRGGNAHRVLPISYKGKIKLKNCISGRGRSIWSMKALQKSFMEGQSCAQRQLLCLGGSCWNGSLFPSWLGKPPPPAQGLSLHIPLWTSAGPRAPSQLGPSHVHPPALSEELLVFSLAACAYRRQWMAREQINCQCQRYYWMRKLMFEMS